MRMCKTLTASVVGLCVLAVVPLQAQVAKAVTLTPLDYFEIQQLVARYAYALDTGADNGYAYADLFTPDGVFTGMNQGTKGRSYEGRETLAALARGGRRGPLYVSHFISNVIIESTPEGVKGTQYAAILDIGENRQPSSVTHGGRYEDVYVKTQGGWRFKSRTFYGSEGGRQPRQAQSPASEAPRAPRLPDVSGAPAQVRNVRAGASTLTAEDYLEIQQLVNRYAYALDTGANNGYMYADLFAPDGEFIRPYTKGRDNLAKLALDQPHGPQYVRHYLMNHLIESGSTGVTGKEYLVVIDIGENKKPSSIFIGGHYEDIYVKTMEGWRFKRREFIPSRSGLQAPEAGQGR